MCFTVAGYVPLGKSLLFKSNTLTVNNVTTILHLFHSKFGLKWKDTALDWKTMAIGWTEDPWLADTAWVAGLPNYTGHAGPKGILYAGANPPHFCTSYTCPLVMSVAMWMAVSVCRVRAPVLILDVPLARAIRMISCKLKIPISRCLLYAKCC